MIINPNAVTLAGRSYRVSGITGICNSVAVNYDVLINVVLNCVTERGSSVLIRWHDILFLIRDKNLLLLRLCVCGMHVCVCMFVRACVRMCVCVRACVRLRMRVSVSV